MLGSCFNAPWPVATSLAWLRPSSFSTAGSPPAATRVSHGHGACWDGRTQRARKGAEGVAHRKAQRLALDRQKLLVLAQPPPVLAREGGGLLGSGLGLPRCAESQPVRCRSGARAGAASSEPDSESAAAREQGARHAGAGSESRPRQASRGARAARPREWPPSLRVALCWGGGRNSLCFYRGRNQTPPNTNTNTRLGYNPQRAPAAAAARPLVAECSCRGVLTARASGSRLRLL